MGLLAAAPIAEAAQTVTYLSLDVKARRYIGGRLFALAVVAANTS